ncbi:hypothetical protein [Priestia filamentosa]|uniref:hypothetical protein n=1 Tax=Priestia filamentosa TaxID=1402861 RepID=UPI002E214EC6|nr:hypothetical protein [Priestia filamentosa]
MKQLSLDGEVLALDWYQKSIAAEGIDGERNKEKTEEEEREDELVQAILSD